MRIAFDSMLAWFLVSFAAIGIALVTSHLFNRRTKKLTKHLAQLSTKNSESVKQIIKEQLSPTIHLHDGLNQVTRRVADIIREVTKYNSSDRTIEFFGAASLAAPDDDQIQIASLTEEEGKHSSRIYEEAVGDAKTANVTLKRYISLFTEENLRERSVKVQKQYLAWLKHQVRLLDDYSKYELAHVVRAPNWGSNMARIITKNHVMEITGNGKAAIVITDVHIAERIRQYSYDSVIGKSPKNPIVVYGKSAEAATLDDLNRDYVEVAERVLNEQIEKEVQAKKSEAIKQE